MKNKNEILNSLPKNYKEITLRKYQEIHKYIDAIQNPGGITKVEETLGKMDNWTSILSKLTGIEGSEIEQLDTKVLKKCIDKVSFLLNSLPKLPKRFIKLEGELFKVDRYFKDLTSEQQRDIYYAIDGAENIIQKLHEIAPCIYKQFVWRDHHTNKWLPQLLKFVYRTHHHYRDIEFKGSRVHTKPEFFLNSSCHDTLALALIFCHVNAIIDSVKESSTQPLVNV